MSKEFIKNVCKVVDHDWSQAFATKVDSTFVIISLTERCGRCREKYEDTVRIRRTELYKNHQDILDRAEIRLKLGIENKKRL